MTLGEKIALLRSQKKLTQERLAQALGISRASLAKYETNKNEPDLDTIRKIANFFDVSIDYLLDNTTSKKQSVDIKEALEDKNKKATWGGKELTDEQREKLKRIFAVIRDELLTEKEKESGNGENSETGDKTLAM